MLTVPYVIVLYITSIKLDFRWLLARKRTRRTPTSLTRLAKEMGAPLPRRTMLVTMDRPNAGTDGTTLFITSGMEPYLCTSVGEAVLAHELAHAKLRHHVKHLLVVEAVLLIAYLFGAQIWPLQNQIGAAMGVLAFLTLGAFVFPWVSRRMEYDADALACKVVGPTAMIGVLKVLVPTERWALESDSHPSAKARTQRLRAS